MKKYHGMAVCLVFAILWLPAAGIAGEEGPAANPPTATQEKPPHSSSTGSPSDPKEKTAKKSDRGDVKSRGLFQKKKKKQKGGSAGHSQTGEQTEAPAQ